jgi:hypothetical protein
MTVRRLVPAHCHVRGVSIERAGPPGRRPSALPFRVVSADLEELLNAFKRQHPCCKSATVRLETICLGGEPNCLQRVSTFLTSHDLQARRTPNGLEFTAEDLARAVEIYDRESL